MLRSSELHNPPFARATSARAAAASPSQETHDVDSREFYCLPVQDQLDLATSSAHACVGLFQYFERRATGEVITPSRLFLHANALHYRVATMRAERLRITFKAAVKLSLPSRPRFWPYDPAALGAGSRCVRLRLQCGIPRRGPTSGSTRPCSPASETLETVRSLLAAGFACALGFGVPSSLSQRAREIISSGGSSWDFTTGTPVGCGSAQRRSTIQSLSGLSQCSSSDTDGAGAVASCPLALSPRRAAAAEPRLDGPATQVAAFRRVPQPVLSRFIGSARSSRFRLGGTGGLPASVLRRKRAPLHWRTSRQCHLTF